MERKVYELSGNLTQSNKDQAVQVTLGSDVDQIAGPATMNVVRVRCPSQCVGLGDSIVGSGATLVEPVITLISGNSGGGDDITEVTKNYDGTDQPTVVNVRLYSDDTTVNIFNNGALINGGTEHATVDVPQLQATVAPYTSPAGAMINFEDAIDIAAKSGSVIEVDNVDAGSPSLQGHTEYIYYQTTEGDVEVKIVETAGGSTDREYLFNETLSLRAGVTRFSPNIVDLPGFVKIPNHDYAGAQLGFVATPLQSDGTADTARVYRHVALAFHKEVYVPSSSGEVQYKTNTSLSLVNDVLQLEYESKKPVTFNSLAAERLSLSPALNWKTNYYIAKGVRSPSFNDVRRIVMTLTPDTQKVVAKDASDPQGTLYDKASISFTVDDDPTDNSAYAAYSLAGDFDTNSLRLKNGATDSISFHLQRCVYDRATGKLGRPEALDLPYANNFVEVKIVADKKKRLASDGIDG